MTQTQTTDIVRGVPDHGYDHTTVRAGRRHKGQTYLAVNSPYGTAGILLDPERVRELIAGLEDLLT
jgi:hypothetical protein